MLDQLQYHEEVSQLSESGQIVGYCLIVTSLSGFRPCLLAANSHVIPAVVLDA